MKKYTKKQIEAISYLVSDLDELDNKPRRLFESLRKVVEEFIIADKKDKEGKEYKLEILDSIDEFERIYYRFLNVPDLMRDVGQSSKDTIRELTSRKEIAYMDDDSQSSYCRGVEEACQEMVKNLVADLLDLN